jgi:hypothetical protein
MYKVCRSENLEVKDNTRDSGTERMAMTLRTIGWEAVN